MISDIVFFTCAFCVICMFYIYMFYLINSQPLTINQTKRYKPLTVLDLVYGYSMLYMLCRKYIFRIIRLFYSMILNHGDANIFLCKRLLLIQILWLYKWSGMFGVQNQLSRPLQDIAHQTSATQYNKDNIECWESALNPLFHYRCKQSQI